MLSVVGGHFQL